MKWERDSHSRQQRVGCWAQTSPWRGGVYRVAISRQLHGMKLLAFCELLGLRTLSMSKIISMHLLSLPGLPFWPENTRKSLWFRAVSVINKEKLIFLLFNNKTIKCNQPSESLLLTLAIFILTWPHNNCMISSPSEEGRKINFHNVFLSALRREGLKRRRGRAEKGNLSTWDAVND